MGHEKLRNFIFVENVGHEEGHEKLLTFIYVENVGHEGDTKKIPNWN